MSRHDDDRGRHHRRRAPKLFHSFMAELLGTFFLVLLGDGAIAQWKLQGGNFLHVAIGYGLALMVGILISGGVSGGHLNPAVTFTACLFRKCSWVRLPVYWAAQFLGAFVAASVLFGVYNDGIMYDLQGRDLASAGIFASYPANENINIATLIFDQVLGTAVLLIVIFAVTDEKNMKVPSGLVALLIGLGLTSIHISLAFNAGSAVNPARDFSP